MLTHDLRDAARNLRRNGGFAASAIAMLAVGIAASTGLFAVVDAVVLRPLPYVDADRLARVELVTPSDPVRPASVTVDEFRVLRQALTLDDAYIRDSFTRTLDGNAFPESVWTESYSGNALSLLGVRPVTGRVFTEADAPIGTDSQRVAVLTSQFWQRRFGGRPDAVGETLQLDGEPFTVIGVVPAAYSLDLTDVLLPLPMNIEGAAWAPLVRLRSESSIAAAEVELQTLFERFARVREGALPPDARVRLRRLVDAERGASHVPMLTTLFAAAALLLLIGCVNVMIVLLGFAGVALLLASFGLFSVASRSIAYRTRELGIRIALGAAPRAVLRSAMQPLVVAVAAGLVTGLAVSAAAGSLLARWSIPSPNDPLVLAGAVATLLLATLAATVIPARRAISVDPAVALRAD